VHLEKERLEARRDNPKKQWKFNLGDLDTRERWSDYVAAYGEAVRETSTERAPWYVVPSDRKWYRNVAVGLVLMKALEALDLRLPESDVEEPGEVEIV
jgi:polyphosphate kinase 2 (PPK2 family)